MFNIRKVTNIFKQTAVKIAFRGKNTLARLVKTTNTTRTPTPNKPGIYQLTCSTCNLAYICQTSRDLKTRYHEHIRYIKNNNPQSVHAQHTLNNRHKFGTIDNIMTLLKPIHSQHLLTTNEQFYIRAFLSQKRQTHFRTIPRQPKPSLCLTTHPSQPRANRASCATNCSMDTLPANRFWQPYCSHGMYFNLLTHRTTPAYSNETTTHYTPHNKHT